MFPANDEVWYFPREEIEKNSPSRLDGISSEKEFLLRISYSIFLEDLGYKLGAPQPIIARAMILSHRFFLRQSHAKNDRWTVAALCIFISAKIDATPVSLARVIVVSYGIVHKRAIPPDEREQVYRRYKYAFLSGEKLVLSTLDFDLFVGLPYHHLNGAVETLIPQDLEDQFTKVAFEVVRCCFCGTTLCFQYRPPQIAAAAFFIAAMFLDLRGWGPLGGKDWLQQFDLTLDQVDDIRSQIVEMMHHEANLIPPSKGSTGETSTSGDAAPKSVTTDEVEGGSSNVDISPEGVEDDPAAEMGKLNG